MKYSKPKGTRDIFLDDMSLWQYMEENIREVAKEYNVKEIRTPVFESTEVFARGVGDETDIVNEFILDGRICKLDDLHTTASGKQNIHLVLANNIISSDGKSKINNYIPVVCWGNLAKQISEMHVSDKITLRGQLHSRTYKKVQEDGELQILTAHEGVGLELLDYEARL